MAAAQKERLQAVHDDGCRQKGRERDFRLEEFL